MTRYGTLPLHPTPDLAEVTWLLDSGETLLRIAARLGTTPLAIERATYRSGRRELLARVQRAWIS